MCSGDRTVRHNTVRDILYDEAVTGALNPHREKAGLLPSRPSEDGLTSVGEARRPADIWLPRGMQGGPKALDFAVTSGMQADTYRSVIDNPSSVFDHYENFKRS